MKKFGKSSKNVINHEAWKKKNAEMLERSNFLADLYTRQPIRKNCKICQSPLSEQTDFLIRNVIYKICKNCGHLNGGFDDTASYAEKIYESNDPKKYGQNYINLNIDGFEQRTSEIYKPKVEFLFSALQSQNESPASLKYIDIGAGAGHFLAALHKQGIPHPQGVEISSILVSSGKEHLAVCAPGAKLQKIDNSNLVEAIYSSQCDVVSMIGVLEHLRNPHKILEAFSKANSCRYLFLSIPMFSPSVCIESAFPAMAPRHLEGGHTHLFTEKSINWLAQFHGWTSVGEWWFGADIIDLLRAISVTLHGQNSASKLEAIWQQWLDSETVDSMQLILDQKKSCSELHILFKK